MPAIIHINDNNILVNQNGQLSRSQGYAWLLNGEVYFDLASEHNAVRHCRLEPQEINSHYWQQCAQTSVADNSSGMRHSADIIWRHLSELTSAFDLNEVILVVPSHYQADNLQLLLGICKACNLAVKGMVNKAVLALQERISNSGRYLHVDVQLHQTVCSEVIAEVGESSAGIIRLGEIEILHEIGLQAMQDALLKGIQERFILNDRFDPLHHAETEQQLFDQLAELATTLRKENKVNISIEHQGRQHASSIDLKQWESALEPFTNPLSDALVTAAADHRYYDFNGFQTLSFSADERSCLSNEPEIFNIQGQFLEGLTNDRLKDASGKIIYLTDLFVDGMGGSRVTSGAEQQVVKKTTVSPNKDKEIAADFGENPTHLLYAGSAVNLDNAEIDLSTSSIGLKFSGRSNLTELFDTGKIFNMSDSTRKQLRVGDRLGSDLADGVVTVIQVLQNSTGDNH